MEFGLSHYCTSLIYSAYVLQRTVEPEDEVICKLSALIHNKIAVKVSPRHFQKYTSIVHASLHCH